MGLIAEIAASVGITVRRSGQMELVATCDLAHFLEAARTHNARILGLEGFRIVDTSIVPDMNAIADFSSIADSSTNAETIHEALQFLSNVNGPDLLYEVTLREEPVQEQ
jgi:hypothetical protein